MIDHDLNAILIKTAALGLVPKLHLGKTLHEMKSHLFNLVKMLLFIQHEVLLVLVKLFHSVFLFGKNISFFSTSYMEKV